MQNQRRVCVFKPVIGRVVEFQLLPIAPCKGEVVVFLERGDVYLGERRQFLHPKRQWRDYLLTPNLTGKLQVILSIIEPGGGSGEEPYAHDSDEECVLVLRGRLEFSVGVDSYLLEEGDSIVFESRTPHRNRNPGPGQAEVLWITTPPSY